MKRILVGLMLMLFVISASGYFFTKQQIISPLNVSETTLYTVKSGTTFNQMLNDLRKRDWLKRPLWIKLYSKIEPRLTQIKAGTYQVSPNIGLLSFIQLINEGKEHQFKVTFVEGSTFKEWLAQLSKTEHLKHTLVDKSDQQILKELNITFNHPEGLFFPDTYQFTAGSNDKDILNKAHQRMMFELESSWQNKANKLPYKNSYEALIMASLIEKETAKLSEQPLISAVFITRLAKKMRLQTDPTIIYGLGERYTGDITYANLREKTPYNTYRINGMPPTPIAMPGKSALEASMHPADSPYLYFVSKGNGEHKFSTTLKEHNIAVNKYIRGKG